MTILKTIINFIEINSNLVTLALSTALVVYTLNKMYAYNQKGTELEKVAHTKAMKTSFEFGLGLYAFLGLAVIFLFLISTVFLQFGIDLDLTNFPSTINISGLLFSLIYLSSFKYYLTHTKETDDYLNLLLGMGFKTKK